MTSYHGDALCWRDDTGWHAYSIEHRAEAAGRSFSETVRSLRRVLGARLGVDEDSVYLVTYQRDGAGAWIADMLVHLGRYAMWSVLAWVLSRLIVHLVHHCPPT